MAKTVKSSRKEANQKKLDKYISSIYYSVKNPASYSSAYYIHKEIKKRSKLKVSLGQVQKWLNRQKIYTEFKDVKRKFKKFKLYVGEKDQTWFADTMSVSYLKEYNKPYVYVLVAVDALSRFLRAEPLKTLKASEVKTALNRMMKDSQPKVLITDLGTEFNNVLIHDFLKNKGIDYHYAKNTATKAFLAERKIRDIRSKMQKTITHLGSRKWVHILPDIVKSLNQTYNRSIETTPEYAYNKIPNWELYNTQHPKMINKKVVVKQGRNPPRTKNYYRYKVNQRVKIAVNKQLFNRQIDKKYSNEIFTIVQRGLRDQNLDHYIIKDENKNLIQGSFYANEITPVNGTENDTDIYEIERIISTKKINGVDYSLVRWVAFSREFDSFIPTTEVRNLRWPEVGQKLMV